MAKATAEKGVTKAAAVREALAAGITKPADGATYVKEKHGIDCTPAQFSIYKSQEKKKGGASSGGKRRGRKPGSKNKVKAIDSGNEVGNVPVAAPQGQRTGNASIGVALAKDVKRLVDTYGAAAVKEMADVFGE